MRKLFIIMDYDINLIYEGHAQLHGRQSLCKLGLQSAMGTLKCDGHAKVRWYDALKCDGVPYKEKNAMAPSIRKKRWSAMALQAKMWWRPL